jgi:hypothetical protein
VSRVSEELLNRYHYLIQAEGRDVPTTADLTLFQQIEKSEFAFKVGSLQIVRQLIKNVSEQSKRIKVLEEKLGLSLEEKDWIDL